MSYRFDDLSMTNINFIPLRHNPYASIERFYCPSLKAIEFNVVDIPGFLVDLMYLFIFINILKLFEKKSHTVKKLMNDRKFITEKLFLNGFGTFLAQFFFELSVFAYYSNL